jgi:hypothetical protein
MLKTYFCLKEFGFNLSLIHFNITAAFANKIQNLPLTFVEEYSINKLPEGNRPQACFPASTWETLA